MVGGAGLSLGGGSGFGSFLGAGGGQQQSGSNVQTIEPPSFLREPLTLAAQQAVEQFQGDPRQFFPESTVVNFSPQTEQALQLQEQRALQGSPLLTAAQEQALQTIQGRGVNPFLAGAVETATNPIFERFKEEVLPSLTSNLELSGRTGSGLEDAFRSRALRDFSRTLGEQTGSLAFQSAENEAARQFNALQIAPQLAAQDFANIQALQQVGITREELERQQLQDQIDRFNFGQTVDEQQLNTLIAQLQGVVPAAGTTTTLTANAPQQNRFLTGLGGAASGAATGAAIGSVVPGVGTATGAAVGGGFGLLGGLL
jgi:hypothetical protein